MSSVAHDKPENLEIKGREKDILRAAAELFAQEGFDAVPVRNIAAAAGLKKATLYHYFKDKDEIYTRLVKDTLEKLYNFVAERVATGANARERLTLFMEAQATFFEENIWAATAMLVGSGGVNQPRENELAIYWRDKHEHNLREIIREGVEKGEFRAVDPTITGRAILSTLNWMGRWYKPGGPLPAAHFAREYADLFLNGLT
jgi:AcrR family transcriptional regulator